MQAHPSVVAERIHNTCCALLSLYADLSITMLLAMTYAIVKSHAALFGKGPVG